MQKDVKFKIREGFFFFSNRNYHAQCRSTKNECSCVADIDFLVSKKKKKMAMHTYTYTCIEHVCKTLFSVYS